MIPKVSIIIPIYNCESYLEKCLNSVINQSLKDIEVILVNDGSTDRSKEICTEFLEKDKRIILINQYNKGAAAARNIGIKMAKGEYVGFVDSDDVISLNMFDTLYNNVSKKEDIVQCNYLDINTYNNKKIYVYSELDKIKYIDKYYIYRNIIPMLASNKNRGFYCLWNKIYKKSWLYENKLYLDEDLEIAEDWWFNILCFLNANNVKFINDVLYKYIHQNNQSLMNKYRKNQLELQLECRKRINNILKDYDISEYEIQYNTRFLYELTSNLIKEFNNNNSFSYDKYRKIIQNELVCSASKYYQHINNNTKIYWYIVYRGRYFLSYKLFKLLYFIYKLKNRKI